MRLCFRVGLALWMLIAGLSLFDESRAGADSPVAWSFVTDQELPYEISQRMTQQMTILTGEDDAPRQTEQEEVQLSLDWKLSLLWRVREVNDDGTATLQQTVRRVELRMTSPGLTVELDSAATEDAVGPAAMLSPLMTALVEHPLLFSATSRGQLTTLEIPDPLAAALKNSPGAGPWAAWTAPGLRMLVKQILLPLPPGGADLQPGYDWQENVELAPVSWNTADEGSGDQAPTVVQIGYRYDGRREEGGLPLAVFIPEITMRFPQSAGIDVQSQSTRGQLLFHAEAGRLESADVVRNLVLTRDDDDESLRQQIEQSSAVRWLGS